MYKTLGTLSFLLGLLLGTAFGAETEPPGVPYLIWDGHRFARTPEDCRRDVRWYRDLGFTHSLIGANLRFENGKSKSAEMDGQLTALFAAFDEAGLYAGLRFPWDFDAFPGTPEERIASGVQLAKNTGGTHPTYNPMHPDVIAYYTEAFERTIAHYLKHDEGKRLQWFLIGTERTWGFPKSAEDWHPQAFEVVCRAAREDGVLKEGEADFAKLSDWWNGAHGHGRDWRLRKSVEDAILKLIPKAEFFVDPNWAVKIVHGFGGDWTYIDGDPKNIAFAVLRLEAQCRPAPTIHSTQLIRGSYHDCILESNLLSICMGADRLYHWGVHTLEPGHEANPYYRQKIEKTPETEARLIEELRAKRREKEPALRATGRLLRDRGTLFRDWKPAGPRIALLTGVYGGTETLHGLMAGHLPFDILREQSDRRANLKKYSCIASAKTQVSPADYADLLELERSGATILIPPGFQVPEGQPALAKAVVWEPEFMLPKPVTGADGKPKTPKPPVLSPAEKRTQSHLWAKTFRETFHGANFKPYLDSENFDAVLGAFDYRGVQIAFVVNDLRKSNGEAGGPESLGVDNDLELLIRDEREGLRARDIESGEELALAKSSDGWRVKLNVPAAWYRLIAILGPNEQWTGPKPLAQGPELLEPTATREATGVKLAWKLPFADWMGCDIERYEVLRAEGDAEPVALAVIPGRIMTGPGGVVTEYLDTTAHAGQAYSYRLRTLTPLRQKGALTNVIRVK
ncbi:MAG: hypothetical protein AMXMBFR7_24420 [Planctomycetota bacterium]